MEKSKNRKRDFEKENEKIFQLISGIFTLTALTFFLIFVQPWRGRGCYLNENSIFQKEFKGRVIEKFIDYPNHATESVRFITNQKIGLLRGKYFDSIEIGDSIHKVENSFNLEIHKKGKLIEMTYKLPCEEEGSLFHE